ncbi:MAG: ABC transporter permease [Sulfuriferula sp.]|nr:ABC transporter permease [Sulfuriferula sp.]
MMAYLLRRLRDAIPILLGVNLLTFTLFFVVNTPDDMAHMHLGAKHVTPQAVAQWKTEHGYDLPLFYNSAHTDIDSVTDTIFFNKSLRMFALDFGAADDGRDIANEIKTRAGPSLAIAVPVFILGLLVNISFALMMVFFRHTYLDGLGVVLAVVLMSISGLFYIIAGQFFIAKLWHWLPISGFATGIDAWRFVLLPVLISVVGGIGSGTRWYRSIFLAEIGKDYVRTARAKGLSESRILFRHVLQNGMIPILTGAVVVLPLLFMGSLLTESFFGIPGLGSYVIDAIQAQDFAIVRAMVFIGAVLYLVGLWLTDIAYSWADPRVRLS